jgi:hypothetical protein
VDSAAIRGRPRVLGILLSRVLFSSWKVRSGFGVADSAATLPSPPFSVVFILKGLRDGVFVSTHSKRLTSEPSCKYGI